MRTLTPPAPAVTVAVLDRWLADLADLDRSGSILPLTDTRRMLSEILDETVTAPQYSVVTWEFILRRARRALRNRI